MSAMSTTKHHHATKVGALHSHRTPSPVSDVEFEQPAARRSTDSMGDVLPPGKSHTGYQSEGGHHLTQIAPLAKHSGKSVASFFNGLFTTVIALGTLGTSITFSFIISNETSPPASGSRYTDSDVQFFLAISWLLFLLTLTIASLGSTLLTFFRKHWVHDWDGGHGRHSQLTVQLYAVGISATMGALIIAAFIFMCLVVVAHVPVVGWISLGFTGFFGVIVLISIGNQVPWPWIKSRQPPSKDVEKGN